VIFVDVGEEKIVEFDKYCKICKYKDLPETEDPCWDCLEDPVNVYSHRPTGFVDANAK
jgi:hypothetical protein